MSGDDRIIELKTALSEAVALIKRGSSSTSYVEALRLECVLKDQPFGISNEEFRTVQQLRLDEANAKAEALIERHMSSRSVGASDPHYRNSKSVIDACAAMHGASSGSGDGMSDEDWNNCREWLVYRLNDWRPTTPHVESLQAYDEAVKQLVVATLGLRNV